MLLPAGLATTSTTVPHLSQSSSAGNIIFFVVCGVLASGAGALLLATRAKRAAALAELVPPADET